ncbi:hypothetical protein PC41400_02795 [Paenibacillus chitinolyticus]|uniref:VanW family protein n=1 Tax=Paenibacillus chitinolyticus TaxID=79263 RepID=A0A410WQT6_9BACL|nr:VanW family protein [Paenibacillus chitinolyticus]MCY9591669.1 VanW family protein [Paenibacillus chitinolyticus]MCY9596028.1 VanW family protein [Paenibacillus chitinolyticus]QAV16680.1 hypothetical protein PC41400_02795 [Paenibacillus chitinolyticus]
MKPVKRVLTTIAIVLPLAAVVGLGSIAFYGSRPTFPEQFSVSGWKVGGMAYADFPRQLSRQVALLNSVPVQLLSNRKDVPSRSQKLQDLGLRVDDRELQALLHDLTKGNLLDRARNRWKLRHYEAKIGLSIEADQLDKKLQSLWPELYAVQPVSAQRIVTPDDRVQYKAGQPALRVDTSRLKADIERQIRQIDPKRAENPLSIQVPFRLQEPEVTEKMLRGQHVDRLITQFSTPLNQSSPGRRHNVRSTAATLHEVILKPGEIFDYAPIIEQTGVKFGFREAPVILNGKLVPGVGGGICQVSTTLYNAVLRAGLEIVERRNHSLPISYAPLGQDATFSTGFINFRFRNDTKAHLLIRTEMSDTALTIKLFGSVPTDTTYEIMSNTVETIQPPVKYVHNPGLKTGEQVELSPGKQGFVVDTYRIKKQGGKEVSREKISRDRYTPQARVVASNTGVLKPPVESAPPQKNVIEDGVTQNGSTP